MSSRSALRVVLVLAAAAAVIAAVVTLQDKRRIALATVDEIEAQLTALDPATRAAVLARLGRDAVQTVRSH